MIEGLILTVVGMTTVFLFLLLLIGMIQASAAVIQRFFAEPATTAPVLPRPGADDQQRRARVAVALAMVHRHRALRAAR